MKSTTIYKCQACSGFIYTNISNEKVSLFRFKPSKTVQPWGGCKRHIHHPLDLLRCVWEPHLSVCVCLCVVLAGQQDASSSTAGHIFETFRWWNSAWITAFCGGAMWAEMDGGGEEEGQEMRGSWALGTSLHAPPLTHLALGCRGGGGGGRGRSGRMMRTSPICRGGAHDLQRRVVWLYVCGGWCTPSGRWTHKLYNIITSCVAPENHKVVGCRAKWLDGLLKTSDSHRYKVLFLFCFVVRIFESGCKDNFNKYKKKCFPP